MEILNTLFGTLIPFVIVFTTLVFVHELGHYLIARYNRVRVETFSIGFGPELFGWNDSHGTRWKVAAVPLGGYVKMFGDQDDDDAPLTAEEEAVSFHHKRLRQRTAIVAAGPLANFLFAIVLFAGLFMAVGVPTPQAGIGTIQSNSAAEDAGFESGDLILSIDGAPIATFDELRRTVMEKPNVPLTFEVQRGESVLVLTATPKAVPGGDDGSMGQLGVTPDPAYVGHDRLNPLSALWSGVEWTYFLTTQILDALWQIISGSRTADELGGPLRIAQLSGEMAQGGIESLIRFMAVLSINLGLINLFPVPMLDGGHLVFYAVEAIRGRPLNRRTQEYGFRVGLLLVIMLMVFATWNDLVQLEVVDYVRQLVS